MNATRSPAPAGAQPAPSADAADESTNDPIASAASLVASLDTTSTSRIQSLGRIHEARLANQTRSAADAVAQYGTESPEAISARAAVAATKTTVGRIQVVQRQVATPDPSVASGGWVLHGRVFNADLTPLARHTVYLVDAQNRYVDAHGYAYTDESGYFLMRDTGQVGESPATKAAAPKPSSRSKRAVAAEETAPADATGDGAGLFIAIANDDALPVYLGPDAFASVTGKATYRSLTLAPGAKPIGDPPGAVRAVAIPPIGSDGTTKR